MFHPGAGAVNRGPAPLPRTVTKIQVFHVGRIVNFRDSAQLPKPDSIEERTAAASVQHPGEVFTGQRVVAPHREIQPVLLAPNCLAGFFPANTGGKEDLCGSAEQIRDLAKSRLQCTDEPGLRDHVIVQHQSVSELRFRKTGIDGLCKRQGLGRLYYHNSRPVLRQPLPGAIGRAVVHHDNFTRVLNLRSQRRQHGLE